MFLFKHGSLGKAKEECRRHKYTDAEIDRAAAIIIKRRKLFEDMDPAPICNADRFRWYCGPTKKSRFWNGYVNRLRSIPWKSDAIDRLDRMTSKVMDLIDPPGNKEIDSRGLVVGKVQSGKTAHFTGLLAKAADSGYRIIIVLSGITNSLRLQTQKRLRRDLEDESCKGLWYWLTKNEIFGDFEAQSPDNANLALKLSENRSIAVVKKQSQVLRALIDWLNAGNGILRRDCPVLVIDDEADQASVNTGKSMEWDELSKINQRISELLKILPKSAYVGYTATPFANVLIHPHYPQNLYPRSFIFPLDPPKDYFGPERIHGRDRMQHDESDVDTDGLPLIRIVPDTELPHLKPTKVKDRATFKFKVTASLTDALKYFLMATAARLCREKRDGIEMDYSTMLIHTSQLVDVHQQTERQVARCLATLDQAIGSGSLQDWETLWLHECRRIDRRKLNENLKEVSFNDLKPYLREAMRRRRLVVSNSMQDEETNVTFEKPGQVMIVVGGNTLSRGLTLEGLQVSYFVRSANAFDTILQMGRWFGYRRGYEDLPRIWMTAEMKGHFHDLATIEQEFRDLIDEYQAKGLTPLDAAIRIRRHPKMRITAPNKMRFAVTCDTSYRGARPQTIYFNHKDPDWLDANIDATKKLLSKLGKPSHANGGRHLWKGVGAGEIIRFLNQYQFHERSRDLDRKLMIKYIEKQNRAKSLVSWNVVVLGLHPADDALGEINLRDDLRVGLINRSKIDNGMASTAYIKALMSPTDIVADMPELPASELKGKKARELFALRNDERSGVLLIYPISPKSRPSRKDSENSERTELGAVDNVIGTAFVFPDPVGDPRDADYVSADLKPIESEDSSEEEDDPGRKVAKRG